MKCVGHGFVQGSAKLLYAEVTGSISDGQGCPGWPGIWRKSL